MAFRPAIAMAFCASPPSGASRRCRAASTSNDFGGLTMNDTTAVTRSDEASRTAATTRSESAARRDAALIPPVDVIEDSTGITLHADLPGVPKDKLSLHVEAETLTIE